MNYSPLNDNEFRKHREEVHRKAAQKRRVRTLIILASVALVSLAAVTLLIFGITDALRRQPIKPYTPPPLPPISSESEKSTETPTPDPSTQSESVSPSIPLTPDSSTPEPPTVPTGAIHKTTVYIDPGHGFLSPSGKSMDLGAGDKSLYTTISAEEYGKALYEADLNLMISVKLRNKLIAAGYDVIMSREGYVNVAMSLDNRAAKVRASTADVFISVHANFFDSDSSVYGARVYACDSNRRKDGAACQSYAKTVINAINEAGASRKPATLQNGNSLAMCNSTSTTPAILVETCFLTNELDARNALTEEWQELMATALFNGITSEFPLEYTFE